MRDENDTASNTQVNDIFDFDTWVLALEKIRQQGDYWRGITKLGKQDPIWQESFTTTTDEGEINRVKQVYDEKWQQIRPAFESIELMDTNGNDQNLADALETAMHFSTEIMMKPRSPFVNAMYSWMMSHEGKPDNENPLKPEFYMGDDGNPLQQYGIRAKLLEGMGQAILQRSRDLDFDKPTSWGFEQCQKDGVATPKYIAKNANGGWDDISSEQLQAMLSDPNGPHVVMTANHAFLESESTDLQSITSGVETLLRKSVKDEPLPIKNGKEFYDRKDATTHPDLHIKGYDEQPTAGDTVMVAAIYSRENNILNLAHLFRRLDQVKQHKKDPENDNFKDISPASLMLASTVFKTILKEVDRVLNADAKPELLNVGAGEYGRSETPNLLVGEGFHFKEDAAERLRHLVEVGFSQGGNVMRDALRYVVHEIDRVQVKGPDASMSTQEAARDILSSFSVTALSLNEEEMSQHYIDYGINCGMISNARERRDRQGFIAVPPEHHHSTSDPVIIFDAFDEDHGHNPNRMFQAIIQKGGHALSHFQCGFAPNIGKVALRAIDRDGDNLLLELSGRSKQENVESAFKKLQAALAEAGVPGAQLSHDARTDVGRRQYRLKLDGIADSDDKEVKKSALAAVRSAFGKVKDSVVFADDVFNGLNIVERNDSSVDVNAEVERMRMMSNFVSDRTAPTNKISDAGEREAKYHEGMLADMHDTQKALEEVGRAL